MLPHRSRAWLLSLWLVAPGCAGDEQPPGDPMTLPDDPSPPPFEPNTPAVYTAKVKNLLTGAPVTDAEVSAVQKDPAALAGLIDQWMTQPEFQANMLAFFRTAFQQGQVSLVDFVDQTRNTLNVSGTTGPLLLQNLQDSFPRTVWAQVQAGRPFHEAVTTRTFYMTTALRSFYAYLDNQYSDDNGGFRNRALDKNKALTVTLSQTMVPLADSINPASPNYMKWYAPLSVANAACPEALALPGTAGTISLFGLFFGNPGQRCPTGNWSSAPLLDAAAFNDWQPVSVRAPKANEAVTLFWDLPALGKARELLLSVPRIGFFSTPAFFANWQTNTSNQARVTINQSLIVALGRSFDESNSIVPVAEPALAKEHAAPGTACYACHRTLDPMRQFFRQAYTLYYHEQLDPKQTSVNGVFAFDNVTAQGQSLDDLAQQLARHPRFAAAWAQKLCYWANSAPCVEGDPEFQRVVDLFRSSGYKFKELVRTLLASPLVTGAARTQTATEQGGPLVGISRREQLCGALSRRLGLSDVCGLSGAGALSANQTRALTQAIDLPADGYSRGAEAPTLATDPTLFTRLATENLCRIIADQVVDAGMTPRYSSKSPDPAVADLTRTVMGLPDSDARSAAARRVLRAHFDKAQAAALMAAKLSPTDALKSTFVLACEAPSSVAMGL